MLGTDWIGPGRQPLALSDTLPIQGTSEEPGVSGPRNRGRGMHEHLWAQGMTREGGCGVVAAEAGAPHVLPSRFRRYGCSNRSVLAEKAEPGRDAGKRAVRFV